MNDEIKEILVLQNYVNRYKNDEKAIINHSRLTTPLMLDYLEVKNILDYITNLQESEAYYYGQYKDYKSRMEKAVEYIGEYKDYCDKEVCDCTPEYFEDLLDILNGRSDE